VNEALAALAEAPGPCRLIAGGTDLLLDLEQGRHPAVHTLVDVTQIPELRGIRDEGGTVFVGAAVTHSEIASSDLLRGTATCLTEASALIGGPQVRNVATIGGNVAHALPAADGTIALLSLEAEALIAGPEGRRWQPLETLFEAPGTPAFRREYEMIVGFRFAPARSPIRTAFGRIMRPQGVAIAIMNMAAWVRWGEAGRIEDVRLSLGPAGPRPRRARAAEAALRGKVLSPDTLAEAAWALEDEVRLRTSRHRATQEYRKRLLRVLLGRVMRAAS
jgi:carbon-monoxide dehydrogenase medium subunit